MVFIIYKWLFWKINDYFRRLFALKDNSCFIWLLYEFALNNMNRLALAKLEKLAQ